MVFPFKISNKSSGYIYYYRVTNWMENRMDPDQLKTVDKEQHGFLEVQMKKKYPALARHGLEVIKLEFILKLKINRNDWLLADTCLQAANHCALF